MTCTLCNLDNGHRGGCDGTSWVETDLEKIVNILFKLTSAPELDNLMARSPKPEVWRAVAIVAQRLSMTTVERAASLLADDLDDGVTSSIVGIGEEHGEIVLRAYLRHARILPETYEGFRVIGTVTGELVP